MQSAFSAVSLLRPPLFGSLLGDRSSSWLSRPKHEGGVTSITGLSSLCAFVSYLERRMDKRCSRRVHKKRSSRKEFGWSSRLCACALSAQYFFRNHKEIVFQELTYVSPCFNSSNVDFLFKNVGARATRNAFFS